MKIFNKIDELKSHLAVIKQQGGDIGFVPTMGALHEGHLSLVRDARSENKVVVCSIFVNPTQFNNPDDLAKYPRDFNKDAELLRNEKCDLIFNPDVEEMYPVPPVEKFDFGDLENVMEGAFRPGHFNGVATVVKRLFEIVNPDKAYFGMKDYQQLVIIHKMTKDFNLSVEIVPCSTVREENGLAMSSRNQLLSESEKKQAEILFKTLKYVKIKSGFSSISEIKRYVDRQFRRSKMAKLEYFEIVDMYSLKSLNTWAESNTVIACIAAHVGNVRLIDNIILFS